MSRLQSIALLLFGLVVLFVVGGLAVATAVRQELWVLLVTVTLLDVAAMFLGWALGLAIAEWEANRR